MDDTLLIAASLRRLRVFLEVCRTLHMARAAERLGIAQPSLSEQIVALEKALGAKLFHRRKRGIDLTTAGKLLETEAGLLLAAHANALDKVTRISRGEMGRLAIGYVGSAMAENHLADQLAEMRSAFPDIALTLREAGGKVLIDAVSEGDLDAALVRAPIHLQAPLRHRVHSRQKLVIVLPPNHSLERHKVISVKQLASYPMVGYADYDDEVGITPVVHGAAQAAGIKLQVNWKVTSVGSVLGLVAAGIGFGVVPDHAALRVQSSLSIRPIKEISDSELWLVWHDQRKIETLDKFLGIVGI